MCLIIEDTLAKNWLQGQLKANQTIFDHPFNSELIRVSSEGLFEVLSSLFDKSDITTFRDGYEAARKTENAAARKELFWEVARNFANGAAGAAGGSVLKVMLSQLGLAIL